MLLKMIQRGSHLKKTAQLTWWFDHLPWFTPKSCADASDGSHLRHVEIQAGIGDLKKSKSKQNRGDRG